MQKLSLALLLLTACHRDPGWATPPAMAQTGEASMATPLVVPRLAQAPRLDGVLDDWPGAATLGPLVDPGDGHSVAASHPVAAWARLAWDERALHVALLVRDKKASSPFGREDRDPHVWGRSSGVEVMLQPGDAGDNRDYYELQVDVNGAVFDSHFDDYNAPITGSGTERVFGHEDWSSRVERAIHVEKNAFWSVELAVPWSAFVKARVAIPPRPGDIWRLNLYTFRDGQRQALAWSPLRGQGNFHRTLRFGRIRFE